MGEETSKCKNWKDNANTLLHFVSSQLCQPYNIPVVSDELRKWNENAYGPKIVSIGPRYRGGRDLLPMEEIKWRCMMSLLNRTQKIYHEVLEKCMEDILSVDAAVRTSYVDEIKLDRYDLATIMVFDGCFLLELLISGSVGWNSRLPCRQTYHIEASNFASISGVGDKVRKMELVLSDLTLLENQIPIFILEMLFITLFNKLVPDIRGDSVSRLIKNLALPLFGFDPDLRVNLDLNGFHFLEIASSYIHCEREKLEIEENKENKHASIVVDISGEEAMHGPHVEHLNRCATRLRAAGITVKHVSSVNNIPTAGTVSTFKFNIKFNNKNGILEIPPLNITQTTEAQWRNFIAWEHHKRNWKSSSSIVDRCCIFTSSALLFSDLICCASDVQLLKEKGVIVDDLNLSNRDLVAFFHSITKGVDRGIIDPIYSSIFHALNTYSETSCLTKISILLYHYFSLFLDLIYNLNNFFRRGYNFAISIVTILTVVQTAYAIVAYHFPKN